MNFDNLRKWKNVCKAEKAGGELNISAWIGEVKQEGILKKTTGHFKFQQIYLNDRPFWIYM